jgi:hypothetical protein
VTLNKRVLFAPIECPINPNNLSSGKSPAHAYGTSASGGDLADAMLMGSQMAEKETATTVPCLLAHATTSRGTEILERRLEPRIRDASPC